MKTVLTMGTFDCPHMGHARFLQRCAEYGEVIVGVNSDEFVEQYKKKNPLFDYGERATLIKNLGYTVHPNFSAGRELIDKVWPDIIAIGSDWLSKDYLTQIDVTPEWLDKLNIDLVYIPYTKGISTTEIKRRIHDSHSDE